ncbi:hypothetical protein [Chamaesiphon sp.]|uniref:hypothetical protein n=1 Tax=Chamaesiphon sp. TaxID=2814140 RepID=UPI003593A443
MPFNRTKIRGNGLLNMSEIVHFGAGFANTGINNQQNYLCSECNLLRGAMAIEHLPYTQMPTEIELEPAQVKDIVTTIFIQTTRHFNL